MFHNKHRHYRAIFFAMFMVGLLLAYFVFSVVSSPKTYAATASTLNFQARLETGGGAIAPDGYYNVQFNLYNAATGGTALWTETYGYNGGAPDQRVRVANGYLTVNLGSITAFPSTIPWDQQLYLTMNIGGTGTTASWDGEMSPRLALTAVPYAFNAQSASQLVTTSGSLTSTLSIQAPTVGNQTFQIQDQGAAGTYNLLTAPVGSDGYVKLQAATPTTQQTGGLWVSGTARVDTALQAPLLDTATAGTLSIGTENATTINIATNAVAHSINIGTGAAAQTISIGSSNTSSATTITGGGSSLKVANGGLSITGNMTTSGTISTTAGGAAGTGTQQLASNLYIQSRGTNLVTNGTGLLGNNYNFSGFTFDPQNVYAGGGSFQNSTYSANVQNDELIPVDPTHTYQLSLAAESTVYVSGAHAYFGVSPYDIDGQLIQPQYYMKYPGATDTTLAAPLNPGDTTVTLTNAAGWYNGTANYNSNFVWYGYTNSKGYTYPNYTYSRNSSGNYSSNGTLGAWAAGGISGNVITLRVAWAGPAIAAGTAIRNSSSGGTYKYIAASNVNVPSTWTIYSGRIGTIDTNGTGATSQFPYGTAYVKMVFLLNRDVTGNTTDVSDIAFTDNSGVFAAPTATVVPIIAQGAASQSADLLQLQSATGTVLSKFDSGGNLVISATGTSSFAGSLTTTGLLTGNGGLTVVGATTINGSGAAATNLGTGTGNVVIGNTTGTVTLNSANIKISSAGVISGATGLTSSGTITFSGLTTAGIVTNTAAGQLGTVAVVPVANGGTGINGSTAANGKLLIGNGTGYSLNNLTGTGITITNGAGTIGLTTVYGSSTNTAVQGSTTLVCPTGTGNLAGTGNTITLGTGGTCNSLNTVMNPNFTISVTTPTITTASGDLTIDPVGNTVVKGSTSTTGTAALDIQNSTGSILYARNDGSIGIGTTAPSASLDVRNAQYYQFHLQNQSSSQQLWQGSVADSVGSYIGNNAYYSSSFQFMPNATSASGINFRQDGSTEFWNDTGLTAGTVYTPTKRLVISNSGKVGIGTAAPSQLLDVQGGSINTSASIMTGGSIRIDASGNLTNIGTYTGTGNITTTAAVQGSTISSTVATGTAPLTVASTTVVANLNADMVDGLHASSFAPSSGSGSYIQNQNASAQTGNFWINGTGTVGTLNATTAIQTGGVTRISSTGALTSVTADASILTSGTIAASLLTGTYSGITGTGALTAGSIGSGFGAISTANNIVTTATVQGSTVNATTNLQTGGVTRISSTGALSSVTADASILTSGTLVSGRLTGTYSGVTGTGALTTGSIGTGFGTISTANNITTSANMQGNVVNATTAVTTPAIRPVTDSTTALQVQNAAGTSSILTVDTTNSKVTIGSVSPSTLILSDSMTTTPSGTLVGVATYVSGQYVELTHNVASTYGAIEYTPTVSGDYEADFNLETVGSADSAYFYTNATTTPVNETSATGGYIIYFDEYTSTAALVYNGTTLTSVAFTIGDSSHFYPVRITKVGLTFTVYYNGSQLFSYTDTTRTLTGTKWGLGARSGGQTAYHRVKNLSIYAISPTANAGGLQVGGPVTIQTNTNSTSAFVLNDQNGSPLWNMDTTNHSSHTYGDLLIGGPGVNASTTALDVQDATGTNFFYVQTTDHTVHFDNPGTAGGNVVISSPNNWPGIMLTSPGGLRSDIFRTETGLQLTASNNGSGTGVGTGLAVGNNNAYLSFRPVSDSTTAFFVRNAANVSLLTVDSSNSKVIINTQNTTAGAHVLEFSQSGTVQGYVSINGSTVSYNAFTGSHLAKIDSGMVNPYELASLTGNNTYPPGSNEPIYGVVKSAVANDPNILGSMLGISDGSKPYSDQNTYLVMAAGNGDVMVADNGSGNVQIGDPLISSGDEPGYAMRDNGKFLVSHVFAKAATPIDWSTVTTTVNGVKVAKVSVLFSFYNQNNAANTLQTQTLSVAGSATVGSLIVNGSTSLASLNVTGDAALASVHISGDASITGNVTIAGTLQTADIYVGGKVVTVGAAPTVTAGGALGQASTGTPAPVATVHGTDSAGTISAVTAVSSTTQGVIAHVAFNQPYTSDYTVLVSPNDAQTAALRLYTIKTAAGFDIVSLDPLQASTSYSLSYMVEGFKVTP